MLTHQSCVGSFIPQKIFRYIHYIVFPKRVVRRERRETNDSETGEIDDTEREEVNDKKDEERTNKRQREREEVNEREKERGEVNDRDTGKHFHCRFILLHAR